MALAALCLGFFMLLLDSTITSVALPAIVHDLRTSNSVALWVNSGYLLAYAVPLLIAGRFGDRWGHRRVYLVGLVLFVIGSALCASAPTIAVLVLFRVLQGVGAALLTPQCLVIIRSLFARERLGAALSVWSGVGGAATVAGPLVGGVLLAVADWRALFWVNVPVGILAFCCVLAWVPATRGPRARLSLFALAACLVGVFAIVIGIQGTDASPLVLGIPRVAWCAVGLALLVIVVVAQRTLGAAALVPIAALRRRSLLLASIGAAAAAFAVGSAPIPLMLDLQQTRHLSAIVAASVLVPMGVACLACVPLAAVMNRRAGARATALIGVAVLVASIASAAVLIAVSAPTWCLAVAFAGFGAANSLVWSPFSVTAVGDVPQALAGSASSSFNTMKQLGAAMGSAVTASVLAVASDSVALMVLAVVAALAAPAALWMAQRRPRLPVVRDGVVIRGAGQGHGLGYPTANLRLHRRASLPPDGVYLGRFGVDGWPEPRHALISVGANETFEGRRRTIEAHVLDFAGDLYGQHAHVELHRLLREQRAFVSTAELVSAMRIDEERARIMIMSPHTTPRREAHR